MNELISIIIPVYNVEQYIGPCLDSILAQLHHNFEAILIDDGSSDRSGAICDEYAAMDSRFSCVHIPNGGVGNARNLGLQKMTGEYCFFLDPDDVMDPEVLTHLLSIMKEHGADIALGAVKMFSKEPALCKDTADIRVYHGSDEVMQKVLFDKRDLKSLDRRREPSSVEYLFCSCLYRTEMIRRIDNRFLPITYGEDTYFCFRYLLQATTAVTTSKITYWYRRNLKSTTYRYHNNYLAETKVYYNSYLSLFESMGRSFYEQAKRGVETQYFLRCVSAIERELFLSPLDRSMKNIYATIRQIRNDELFCKLCSFVSIKYIPDGIMRWILRLVKLRIYLPLIPMTKVYRRILR